MKKIVLILMTLPIFSCTSSDNPHFFLPPPPDAIIGNWNRTSAYYVDENGISHQGSQNVCTLMTNQQFTADGSYHNAVSGLDVMGICQTNASDGIWANQSLNHYIVTYPNNNPINITTIFSNNQNTVETLFTSQGVTFHNIWQRQ